MNTVKYSISFTAKSGAEAQITGDVNAIQAIENAIERAGIKFNRQVETWDEGYYHDTKCYDLAETFLEDQPHLNNDHRRDELAALIQQTIEDFIAHEASNYEPQAG